MASVLPPPEVLRNLLSYAPTTGTLRFKKRSIDLFQDFDDPYQAWRDFNRARAGKRAATTTAAGGAKTGRLFLHPYRDPNILAHRAIWTLVTGDPLNASDIVRHKNGNKSDNRWKNLYLSKGKGSVRP